eukprot:TRINITY_DN19804_c0_g3_i1.p1 TRINITY_DN19804_c0_g3~~TRINITY_DN19804_c0_g3_i1.p1  ORF type:complete len:293 (+),score=16.66 TRINITY_DN19804_c0_g3_i1:35-913(+)
MLSATMSRRKSVTLGTFEFFDVDAYPLETYELTQEDLTLHLTFCLNARLARKHPVDVSVSRAQRRAACLATHVAKYEPISPRSLRSRVSHDNFESFRSQSTECSGYETTSDYRSFPNSSDGASCGESDTDDQSREASATRSGKIKAIKFWRRVRLDRSRVIPEGEAPSVQSHGEGSLQEQVRAPSRHRRRINSRTRRTIREKDGHTVDGSFDGIDYPSSEDIDHSFRSERSQSSHSFRMLSSERSQSSQNFRTHSSERSQSSLTSLRSFLGQGTSRMKAIIKKVRASSSPKE